MAFTEDIFMKELYYILSQKLQNKIKTIHGNAVLDPITPSLTLKCKSLTNISTRIIAKYLLDFTIYLILKDTDQYDGNIIVRDVLSIVNTENISSKDFTIIGLKHTNTVSDQAKDIFTFRYSMNFKSLIHPIL